MKINKNQLREIFLNKNRPYFWISALIFFVYFSTLFSNIVYLDDNVLVTGNYAFNENIANIFRAFSEDIFRSPIGAGTFYRPILRWTFIFDAQFGQGAAVFMSHFSNILFHMVSVCLLFGLLKKFGIKKETALIFSLIFAVHPLTAQTVAFIPGRNDSLLAIFIFSSLFFFLNYIENWRKEHFFWHLFFFAFALFSKETAIVLPFLCVVYLFILENKKALFLNYKKYAYLLAGWTGILAFWFLVRRLVLDNFIGNADYNFISSIFRNLPALLPAVGKIIFPFGLSVFPVLNDMTMAYGWASLIFLAILFFVSKNKNYKLIIFGMSWFFLFIFLTLIKPAGTVADFSENRIYLPMFGFIFVFLGFGGIIGREEIRRKIMLALGLLVIIIFSVITIYRNGNYKDKNSFWENAVKTSPSFAFNHNNLGAMYYLDKKYEAAQAEFEKALSLNPNERMAHNNLGLVYMSRGEFFKSEEEYDKELEINPYYSNAYANKAILYYKTEKFDEALDAWKKTLEIDPTYAQALYGLFAYYYQKNDKENAMYWAKITRDRGVLMLPEMQDILNPLSGLFK